MRVLDLFSGIGGFSLGLERAGMRTVAFCEIDPYCRAVLKKHWPDAPIFEDVKKLCRRIYDCEPENEFGEVICPRCNIEFGDCECIGTDQFIDEIGAVDVICGGFPCQPFSIAGEGHGKRMGKEDDRYLWPEFSRIVEELGPTWVIGENVIGIGDMALDNVLADLEGMGYAARTFDIPACGIGAIHERRRFFIVANNQGDGRKRGKQKALSGKQIQPLRLDERVFQIVGKRSDLPAPQLSGGGDGVSKRLHALGNAVVPQIPEIIGRAIMQAEGMTCA